MKKYTCRQCNGRSGEVVPFALPNGYEYEPFTCPMSGCEKMWIEPLEEYLNREYVTGGEKRLHLGE